MGELNGWTKIGDTFEANGKWCLYRHLAGQMSMLQSKGEWPPEQAEQAAEKYQKLAQSVNVGGLWLVSPAGVVAALIWKPR
jgi:hypothetical protein